jgi:hypothetical protein
MSKLPAAVGLVVRRRLEVDTSTGYVNLIGICHELHYRRFPTLPEPFTIYVHLYGGTGEGTIELLILSLETEQEVYRYRRWAAFGAGQFVHLEIRIRRCSFPAPGRYLLKLHYDSELLSDRVFDAKGASRS